MKNGFYFNTEAIPAEYFLLKKINLIENHDKPLDFKGQEPFLFINEMSYKFCSAFEYHHQSDFVVVFNSMSANQMSELKGKLQQNPSQKILFVAHILFDYQSVLRDLLDLVGPERILILVDNLKHPYIVSENEILSAGIQGLSSNHFLVYTKKSAIAKAKVTPQFFIFLKYSIYYFFKMILKPKQFVQDFFATYNLRFFYGKIKVFFVNMRVFFIKLFFLVRHFSVMSAIRFIYGSKVFFIRFFYWLVGTIKMTSIKIFYGVRHFFIMVPIYLRRLFYWFIEYVKLPIVRFFYWFRDVIKMTSLKIFYGVRHFFVMLPVFFMRFYYWTLEKVKMTSLKLFYSFRHLTVMSFIRFVYGLKVFFIRFFYWLMERLNRLGVGLYYGFRHVLVMSFVHVYYGIKVFVIRTYYRTSGMIKLVAIRSYYLFRHALVMFFVRCSVVVKVSLIFVYYKILAMMNYTHGALIWFYYFNKKYTLYPFRKVYWFIDFQLNKRIWKRNL